MIKKIAKWKGRIAKGVYPICYLCGKPITQVDELSQDHIVPKARGGQTVESNLSPAHKKCNSRKSDMSVAEWFDKMNRQRDQ